MNATGPTEPDLHTQHEGRSSQGERGDYLQKLSIPSTYMVSAKGARSCKSCKEITAFEVNQQAYASPATEVD